MSGKYYEDLKTGQIISHTLGRTISEADNVLFNGMTMNTQPLHINEDFATRQVEPIVEVFMPTPEEVKRARVLIEAHEAH